MAVKPKFFFLVLSLCLLSLRAEASLQLKAEDMQLLDKLKKDMPLTVNKGPVSIANLNLNEQGSVIAAQPGEKLFGMLNFHYDANQLYPEAQHQIVIGFSDLGAQKCIFNEMGYRCGEGITSFFIKAPEAAGLYDVLCLFTQSSSSRDAIGDWESKKEEEMMMIGKILVRDPSLSEVGE